MDFEKNGQSATNFMHKIKKQAKRLFQLSKNNNNLEIKNLSQAQELLAKINGYPDWHSLEKNISNSENILQKNRENSLVLNKFEYHDLSYLKSENIIYSFFRLNNINGSLKNIEFLINEFFNMFDFQLNMKTHNVSLVIEQNNNNNTEVPKNYSLFNISKEFNLTEDQAKKLFYIENSYHKPFYDNELSIYLVVSTEQKNEMEHVNFCLSMKTVFSELEELEKLQEQQIQKLLSNNGIVDNKLNNKLFQKETKNLKKWIYLLNFLTSKKINYVLKYSLLNKEFSYHVEQYDKNKDWIDSFIHSILNTENYPEQELIYQPKPFSNYLSHNNGISLKSQLNNTIINYNSMDSSKLMNVDLILGKPGTGKSVLINSLILGSILSKEMKKIPNTAIIDIGSSSQSLISLIKNVLPKESSHIAKHVKYGSLNDINGIHINPFDLVLGQRKYTDDDIERITPIILSLFEYKNDNFVSLISDVLRNINQLQPKIYHRGIDIEIDKTLDKSTFFTRKNTTWMDVVDFLFMSNEIYLAKKAQTYASVVLSDLLILIKLVISKYGAMSVSFNEFFYLFNDTIEKIIEEYPLLNMPTNLILQNEKIIAIDLENICQHSLNKDFKTLSAYKYLTVVDFLKTNLLKYNHFSYDFNYPKEWNKNWTEYIKKENLKELYNYYHYSQQSFEMSHLVLDEYHRFSQFKDVNLFVYKIVRESRKNNSAVTIASQILADVDYFKTLASGLFVNLGSNFEKNEEKILLDCGFEKNEINFLKKMKFLNWGMKITTNKRKFFDIIKLDVTPQLAFALSNTMEDVYVKNELNERTYFEMPYFNILEKAIKYLQLNNRTSFKSVLKDSTIENKNIVSEILLLE